jgi:hypothetical protein
MYTTPRDSSEENTKHAAKSSMSKRKSLPVLSEEKSGRIIIL